MSRDLRRALLDAALSGADVLPDEVASFLRERAEIDDDDVAQAFFGTALPSLCVYLPDLVAELTERFLCFDPPEDPGKAYWGLEELGLHRFSGCSVRWPWGGPFAHILRVEPDVGIDLAVRITNHATRVWCRRERSSVGSMPNAKTPLPLLVDVEGAARELWGDASVYGWFRCNSVAPDPVCCALMALEQWLLQQAESGTDPSSWLIRILVQAESVGLAGLAISVWLAHPEMCMEAVYPVLRVPLFWRMDWNRLVHDQTGEAESIAGLHALDGLGVAQTLLEVVRQPHRQLRIETALFRLLLREHPSATRLLEDVQAFPDTPQFCFAEEDTPDARADWRETFRAACMRLDLANYEPVTTEAGLVGFRYVPPSEHRAIMEATARQLAGTGVLRLWTWAQAYSVGGEQPDFMSLDEAVAHAERLLQAPTDLGVYDAALVEEQRQEACVMMAAGLVAEDWEWAETHGRLRWCQGILLSAFEGFEAVAPEAARSSLGSSPAFEAAARAAPVLLAAAPGDRRLRSMLAGLLAHPDTEVSLRAFSASQCLWDVDPGTARNVVAFGASLSTVQRFDFNGNLLSEFSRHSRRIVKRFVGTGRVGIPPLAKLDAWAVNYGTLHGALLALPNVHQWDDELWAFMLDVAQLSVSAHDWISQHRSVGSYRSLSALRSSLCGHIARALLGAEYAPRSGKLRRAVTDHWEQMPCLLDALLQAVMIAAQQDSSLENRFVCVWRDFAGLALASDVWDGRQADHSLNTQLEDLGHTLIFTPRYTLWRTDEWHVVGALADTIDFWVVRLGHRRDYFPALPRFLAGRGFFMLASHGIQWLHECLSGASRPADLCHDLGALPHDVSALLRRGWEVQRPALEHSSETWRQFMHLVDILAGLGDREAFRLQRDIRASA